MAISINCPQPGKPGNIFLYCPSLPAAIVFATLFSLLTLIHVALAIQHRRKFYWVVVIAALQETTVFVFRVITILNLDKAKITRAVENSASILVSLSPLWVNGFAYVLFSNMVDFFLPEKNIYGVGAQRLGLVFISLDVVAFVIQSVPGVLSAVVRQKNSPNSANLVNIAVKIYMAGVVLQQIFILAFSWMVLVFHRKVRRLGSSERKALKLVSLIYALLSLITTRIIYKLVEFSGGVESGVSKKEFLFYIFEASTMATAIFIIAIWHPGRILLTPSKAFSQKSTGDAGAFIELSAVEPNSL